MWKGIVRKTYGLGCLAVLMALVLAACESATPDTPAVAAPTVSKELGDIASLTVGINRIISLGDAFKGEELTFMVRSNPRGVVAPEITADNRSIVIRAIGPGTATITVTAKNSGGSVSQSFEVAVPPPPVDPVGPVGPVEPATPPAPADHPSDCPSTLPTTDGMFKVTLKITRELSGDCTLPANHSLIYEETPKRVNVYGPGEGNVWTITAIMKGRPVVKINNDQTGETAGEITVIVPNTPPQLTASAPVVSTTNLMPGHAAGTAYTYVTTPLDPGASFKDADPEDHPADGQGSFRFRVLRKPDGVVIDTDRGFVAVGPADGDVSSALNNAETTMRAVILKNPGEQFDILLHAYDRDNDESDNPVTLTFPAQDPQSGTYPVDVNTDGDFTIEGEKKKLRIGNRIGVTHTISFASGYQFPQIEGTKLATGRRIPDHTYTFAKCDAGEPESWRTTAPTTGIGTGCISIKSNTNDLVVEDWTATNVTVSLSSEHRRLSETSGATLTVTYHVWALSGAKSGEAAVENDDTGPKTIVPRRRTLGIDIHRCVNTDCP